MTSKEKLHYIIGVLTFGGNIPESELEVTFKLVKEVEKDLEVLEILRNNEISISYIKDSSNYNEYIEKCDYFRNLSYIKEEEYNKLKKWLENEVKYYK